MAQGTDSYIFGDGSRGTLTFDLPKNPKANGFLLRNLALLLHVSQTSSTWQLISEHIVIKALWPVASGKSKVKVPLTSRTPEQVSPGLLSTFLANFIHIGSLLFELIRLRTNQTNKSQF